jgi:hypothetical protein
MLIVMKLCYLSVFMVRGKADSFRKILTYLHAFACVALPLNKMPLLHFEFRRD